MKFNKILIIFSLLLLSANTFASDLIQIEGSWYPKGRGSGYIRKVTIPRGGFDFSDPEATMAKGKATFIGSCLSCSQRESIIIGDIETGVAFSSFTKGIDRSEYIEMKAINAETLQINFKLTRRPNVCRPPYNCVWKTVKSGKLVFTKGR